MSAKPEIIMKFDAERQMQEYEVARDGPKYRALVYDLLTITKSAGLDPGDPPIPGRELVEEIRKRSYRLGLQEVCDRAAKMLDNADADRLKSST